MHATAAFLSLGTAVYMGSTQHGSAKSPWGTTTSCLNFPPSQTTNEDPISSPDLLHFLGLPVLVPGLLREKNKIRTERRREEEKQEYTETVKGDIPEEFGEAVRDNREDRETENEDLRSVAVGYELDPPTVFEGHQ